MLHNNDFLMNSTFREVLKCQNFVSKMYRLCDNFHISLNIYVRDNGRRDKIATKSI